MAGASAVLVCLSGVALASCGSGGGGDGYVAVGPGAGSPPRPIVAPTGAVTFVLVEGAAQPSPDSGPPPGMAGSSDGQGGPEAEGSGAASGSDTVHGPGAEPGAPGTSGGSGADGADSGRTTTNAPSPPALSPSTPTGGDTASLSPTGPAGLSVGEPEREPTDERWCEKVTVEFRNNGGTAVRSGTVTFGTHVIDSLGIDWATVESTEKLPAPIAAGASREKTWTVCVEAWGCRWACTSRHGTSR